MSEVSEKKKKKKGSTKHKLLWLFGIIAALFLLRLSSVLLLIGMLPAMVVMFIDEQEERIWTKTIFCFNMAGVYPYLISLMMDHDNSMKALQAQMADATMWLVIYGAAGAGYAAMWICPIAAEFFMRIYNTKRLARHQSKLDYLSEEWGIESSRSQEDW